MNPRIDLIRASEIAKLPVVTVTGGEDAAEIRDVVYDAEQHRLIGFTLNKRGWLSGRLKTSLPIEMVTGIGSDAVMVLDESCLVHDDGAPQALSAPKSDHDVIGNDVVSTSGAVLGTVVDVIIETGEHPEVVGYETETDDGNLLIPASAQTSLSGSNLVVPAAAEEFTRNDLAGFGAAVDSFRDRLKGES
jgi:uncharacterized protein YrrD